MLGVIFENVEVLLVRSVRLVSEARVADQLVGYPGGLTQGVDGQGTREPLSRQTSGREGEEGRGRVN